VVEPYGDDLVRRPGPGASIKEWSQCEEGTETKEGGKESRHVEGGLKGILLEGDNASENFECHRERAQRDRWGDRRG